MKKFNVTFTKIVFQYKGAADPTFSKLIFAKNPEEAKQIVFDVYGANKVMEVNRV